MPIAELRDIWKTYFLGNNRLDVLRGISFSLEPGDMIAIMGPSGSGKSTLLNLLGCLDRPTSGSYLLGGSDVATLNDDELSEIRARRIGFIFQSYNLIPQLNVVENIESPLFYSNVPEQASYERAVLLADRVGLRDRLRHLPTELSGGERQRVGIARALASNPLIILADEPTGNLDSRTGAAILDILQGLHAEGKTIILVTHDPNIARIADRQAHMNDGVLNVE